MSMPVQFRMSLEMTLIDDGRILRQCVLRQPAARRRISTEMASQGETMIAQVFTSKLPAGPMSDEMREWIENVFQKRARTTGSKGLSRIGPGHR